MKLSNNSLTRLVHGSVQNKQKGRGYIVFYRCNDAQMAHTKTVNDFLYERTFFSASITIEFFTDADSFGFDYKILSLGSYDSFDVYVDGLAYKLIDLNNLNNVGRIDVELPKGKKKVVLYLPSDAEVGIKRFIINGKWKKVPTRKETVICYGDSITHGFGSLKASLTYINVMNRELKFNIINQALGGYWFDEGMIQTLGDIYPTKIIVALGTNQLWSDDKYDRIDKYFIKLDKTFPNVPVFVITPIWRGDREDGVSLAIDMREYLIKVCRNYPNINVIDGFKLIPHIDYYFMDNLHPNSIGMEVYGNNLAKEIKKLSK